MNTRIRELLVEAREQTKEGKWNAPTAVWAEKFAELIVRECATAITDDDLAKDCDTFLMQSWAKGMRYSAHLIKEHFGVEQ
jgi:hypothetical protein